MKIYGILAAPLFLTALASNPASAQRGLTLVQDDVPFLSPSQGKMRWTNGRMAGCDFCVGHPILWSVDRQGNRTSITLDIPGAGYVQARDVAAGPDGSLAAVGYAISDDSRTGTFLAWISPDMSRQVITRVWPYDPEEVTVAPDDTIWAVGAMSNEYHTIAHPNVLRHYTASGRLLASATVSGLRGNSSGYARVNGGGSVLMASNDRIGWLTNVCQYVEFSFEPVELGRYACPNGSTKVDDLAGIALSSAGDLLVGSKWLAPLAVLELDRAAGAWRQVPVYTDSGKTRKLLGFDGLTLVTSAVGTSGAMRRYDWSGGRSATGR